MAQSVVLISSSFASSYHCRSSYCYSGTFARRTLMLINKIKLNWNLILILPTQFYITKENRGNEGTCIGVARWPIRDYNHRSTTDMWLYRAYSGSLYHGGELGRALPSFTQGDTITCILDMEARTISFAKNNRVSTFFFPLIYSSRRLAMRKNQVEFMQMRSGPRGRGFASFSHVVVAAIIIYYYYWFIFLGVISISNSVHPVNEYFHHFVSIRYKASRPQCTL